MVTTVSVVIIECNPAFYKGNMTMKKAIILAVALFATTANAATQSEMLDVVCPTKAIKSDKLDNACKARAALKAANLVADVKAPSQELKALFANADFFK